MPVASHVWPAVVVAETYDSRSSPSSPLLAVPEQTNTCMTTHSAAKPAVEAAIFLFSLQVDYHKVLVTLPSHRSTLFRRRDARAVLSSVLSPAAQSGVNLLRDASSRSRFKPLRRCRGPHPGGSSGRRMPLPLVLAGPQCFLQALGDPATGSPCGSGLKRRRRARTVKLLEARRLVGCVVTLLSTLFPLYSPRVYGSKLCSVPTQVRILCRLWCTCGYNTSKATSVCTWRETHYLYCTVPGLSHRPGPSLGAQQPTSCRWTQHGVPYTIRIQ